MSTTTASTGDGRFAGRRVLVTSADQYMGPAVTARFENAGATVIAHHGSYGPGEQDPAAVVAAAQPLDVVVVNLLVVQPLSGVADIPEDVWRSMFDGMVDPTMRFVTAALPEMIKRRSGKIIVVTSTTPLRVSRGLAAYTAARGAQNAYVRAAGAEAAPSNVQINAVAQNYVYGGYAVDALENPAMRAKVMREVPAQRIAEGWEQAELVLFLASESSNFICGQVVPFAGGWVS
jgi:2-keto-3-deoxy-L-fuconate dehydrogenase